MRIEYTSRRLIRPVSVADQLHLVNRRLEEIAAWGTKSEVWLSVSLVGVCLMLRFAKVLYDLLQLRTLFGIGKETSHTDNWAINY